MSSSEWEKSVKAIMMLEIIGRPAEYLTETLEKIIKEMGEEKGVKVKEKKINEPREMENEKDFYTSFAEVEVEVEDIMNLAALMFKYMPSHIEIVSPEKISMSNNNMNEIFNELTRRLHAYDEVARVIQTEKAILEKQLKETLEKNKIKKEEKD